MKTKFAAAVGAAVTGLFKERKFLVKMLFGHKVF